MEQERKPHDLGGQLAIVIGGSRGIGRAISLGLAASGAHVVVASRSPESVRLGGRGDRRARALGRRNSDGRQQARGRRAARRRGEESLRSDRCPRQQRRHQSPVQAPRGPHARGLGPDHERESARSVPGMPRGREGHDRSARWPDRQHHIGDRAPRDQARPAVHRGQSGAHRHDPDAGRGLVLAWYPRQRGRARIRDDGPHERPDEERRHSIAECWTRFRWADSPTPRRSSA